MKITKPNITGGEWNKLEDLVYSSTKGLIADCSNIQGDDIDEINAKAIRAVPDMIGELISDYEAFEWMYKHTNETAIADYCHDKMESIKQTLIKLGCTYE